MWTPQPNGFCPEGQVGTIEIKCQDGSTPVNGKCGTINPIVRTVCKPLPPPEGNWTPNKAYITNIDHIKGASFAEPVDRCPPSWSGTGTCPDTIKDEFGVIALAKTAPLRDVVYSTEPQYTPTDPNFPPEFVQANLDCTVEGSTCNFIGADFSTNVMSEYDTLPYVVNTGYSVPSNVGVFIKNQAPNAPEFTSPPGYKEHSGFDLQHDSQPLDTVQIKETVVECAAACNGRGSDCIGFNYRLMTRACQLVKRTPTARASGTGGLVPPPPFEKVTDVDSFAYIREESLNPDVYTSYPAGTNMTHEGNLCSSAPACNADLTKLVTEGTVTSFSTAELESCAFCPVRSYTNGSTTNEVGTFSGNYQEHLIYKTDPGESSRRLETGFYSVRTWLPDTYNIFGTQTIYYSRDQGMITFSNGKFYGTLIAPISDSFNIDNAAVYDISPVSYVDNGYVFRLFTGGYISRRPEVDAQIVSSDYNRGVRVNIVYSCEYRGGTLSGTKCVGAAVSTAKRGTPTFNKGVFVVTPLENSVAAFFSQLIQDNSKKYIEISDLKYAISLGAPNLKTAVKTSTQTTIPLGSASGYGSNAIYGRFSLNVNATGIRQGDKVTIASINTYGIVFTVISASGMTVTVEPKNKEQDFPTIEGKIIPQGSLIQSALFKREFKYDMFSWYTEMEPNTWTELPLSNDIVKGVVLEMAAEDEPMGDPYEQYGLFRTLPLAPASRASYTTGGCDSGCSEYLLYGCYNRDHNSCDTANGGILTGPVCSGTYKACVPDMNTLKATFTPLISNLTPLNVFRVDNPPGYSGLSHSYDPNMTDINRTRWSTLFIPQTYTDSAGNLHSNVIPTDQTTLSYFPSWTQRRIQSQNYLTITVSLAMSPTGCPGGYYIKEVSHTEFCEICPAGFYCPEGYTRVPAACDPGNYCPQESEVQRQCQAGFYCDTPASQVACPLGFYCPAGTTRAISCDTENTRDGTTVETRTTSDIAATTTLTDSISIPIGMTFVKSAVIGVEGIVGPLQYTNTGTTFHIVTPQFWSATIPSGAKVMVQTRAHYCPIQSAAPQRCGIGHMCPTSSQDLYCPAGNYCRDPEGQGVFAGEQCPTGTFYSPPDITNGLILSLGQPNTDGSHCTACPSNTSGTNVNQSGCICTEPGKVWSTNTGTCIRSCSAGSAPNSDGTACVPCPDGYYTDRDNLPACIKCADNFKSESVTADGVTRATSGAVKCKCTNERATVLQDGVVTGWETLTNGTAAWDQTFNRCKVTCTTSGYVPFWSDCVAPSVNGIYNELVCPDGYATATTPNGKVCTTCPTTWTVPSPLCRANCLEGATYTTGDVATISSDNKTKCSVEWHARVINNKTGGVSGQRSGTFLIDAVRSCATCFTLNQVTKACDFSGGTNSACYTCPTNTVRSYTFNNATYEIYSNAPTGAYCNVLGTNQLPQPSPWGNDSLFDGKGNTIGLQWVLQHLGSMTPRDGSVICVPGKVCFTGTLVNGPSVGTQVTAGTDCPAGYYCISTGRAPKVCPAGSYCSTGSSLPTACSTGDYCPVGSAQANRCPAGSYCERPDIIVGCPAGMYSGTVGATTASTCQICTDGNYCPPGSSQPIPCSSGEYCPLGTGTSVSSSRSCANGYYCPNTRSRHRCPAGVVCQSGSSTNYGSLMCPRTQQPNTDYSACENCPSPGTNHIWDPTTALSSSTVSMPLLIDASTGSYQPISFNNLVFTNGSTFTLGKQVAAETSSGLKITGTVSSFNPTELRIVVTGSSTVAGTGTLWTIKPSGCDTVSVCQGHTTNSSDYTTCQACPMPAAGYRWETDYGCGTTQCTDGQVPSADLRTCTLSSPPTCTTNTDCQGLGQNGLGAYGLMCSAGKCVSCSPGTICPTCPSSTPIWNGVSCTGSPGKYWNGSSFVNCLATCTGGTYESTACTATTNRVCSPCRASCGSGTYETTACTSISNRVCTPCSESLSGQFVSAACTSTTNTQFTPVTCPSGSTATSFDPGSSSRIGSKTCTPDVPPTIIPTGQACPAGQSIVNGVCNACPSGYGYNSLTKSCYGLLDCAPPCTAGTYESTACTQTTDRVCSPCRAACAAGTQEITACTPTTNRECTCPVGQYKVNGVCTQCPAGQYMLNGVCTSCRASCGSGTYESTACTPTTNRVCSPCSTTACASGTFQSSACTSTADRVCTPCGAPCAAGLYQVSACTTTADRVCAGCSGTCGSGTYQTTACTSTTDRVCTACTTCSGSTPYQSAACTSTSNRVCSACPTSTPYWNGSSCTTCPSSSPYWNGTACGNCPTGKWSDNGTCRTCSEPSLTQWVSTKCTATTNTQFSPLACNAGYSATDFDQGSSSRVGYRTCVANAPPTTVPPTQTCPPGQYNGLQGCIVCGDGYAYNPLIRQCYPLL